MQQIDPSDQFFASCPGCHAVQQMYYDLCLIYYRQLFRRLGMGHLRELPAGRYRVVGSNPPIDGSFEPDPS